MAVARTKTVEVGGKSITVTEKRVGELETLLGSIAPDVEKAFNDVKDEKLSMEAVKGFMGAALLGKVQTLFPELDAETVRNAYPSELEALAGAWIDTNFLGLKAVLVPLWQLIQAKLKAQ